MTWSIFNKRLHTWVGLLSALLLIFIFLTGVLLNHPRKWIKGYLSEPLSLASDPSENARLYQGRVDGLWESIDAGNSWQEVDMLYPPPRSCRY